MSETKHNNGSDFGAVIARHEEDYNSFNRGISGDSHKEKIDLSNMTIKEVQRRQHLSIKNKDSLFAVGKYQIIPTTMDSAIKALNISGNEKFTPELQEHIFADYLIAEKRPAIKDYITGESNGAKGLKLAQIAAAYEWASVADPVTGKSKYGTVGNNHAAISSKEVADSLNRMRNKYQSNIDNGMSPDNAYKNVTGLDNINFNNLNSTKTIEFGDNSKDVLQLQKSLNNLGFELTTDGVFGKKTKQTVIDYQNKHQLTVDNGIVNEKTLKTIEQDIQNKKEIKNIEISDFAKGLIQDTKTLCKQKIKELGFKWDQGMENTSIALGYLALSKGFQVVTNIGLSNDLKTIHVGDLSQDRFLNASMPSAVAAQTSAQESMANIAQLEQMQIQKQELAKNQTQQQIIDPTIKPNL